MANACAMKQVLFMGCNRQPSYLTSCSPLLSDNDLNQGEVLIKIICAAICPTDLQKLGNQHLDQEPLSGLGHEGVGEIVATKRSTSNDESEAHLIPGDRVIFCSPLCCNHDIQDHQVFQKLPSSNGVTKYHFGGTFSTHCILKNDTHLFKLPNPISSPLGSIINCPLASMTSALMTSLKFSLTDIQKDSLKVAIIEGTTIKGLYSCAFLREQGFDLVIVAERNHSNWKLIKDFGGLPTCSISSTWDSQIKSILQGNCVTLIIDTVHDKDFCASALDLLSHGGSYILAGTTYRNVMHIPAQMIITKNLKIIGASNYKAEHLKFSVNLVTRTLHKYPYEALVTSPFPFSSFSEAIDCAAGEHLQRVIVEATKTSGS